jgi:RimJ/RimL family protein N-acetyltransferase
VGLAYALAAEYWNKGLATETAQAILKLAFERLGLTNIVCFTLPTNRASRWVKEKVRLDYEREVSLARSPHGLYRITAAG